MNYNYDLIAGDLLKFDEAKYIAHQCNCLTSVGSNLADAMFKAFPYSDVYSHRVSYDRTELPLPGEQPGDIIIRGNGKNERYVINMFAQFYPGGVKYPDSSKDGYIARQTYFKNCLLKIMQIPDLESIAFPYKIGCGVAGGDWNVYSRLIDIFARKMKEEDVKTFVIKLPEA